MWWHAYNCKSLQLKRNTQSEASAARSQFCSAGMHSHRNSNPPPSAHTHTPTVPTCGSPAMNAALTCSLSCSAFSASRAILEGIVTCRQGSNQTQHNTTGGPQLGTLERYMLQLLKARSPWTHTIVQPLINPLHTTQPASTRPHLYGEGCHLVACTQLELRQALPLALLLWPNVNEEDVVVIRQQLKHLFRGGLARIAAKAALVVPEVVVFWGGDGAGWANDVKWRSCW